MSSGERGPQPAAGGEPVGAANQAGTAVAQAAAPVMSGAEILVEALVREGVDLLFGYPGGAILPFYDAMYKDGRLRHVLVRHEQAAAHMADGYARATGRAGVCVATSGPGATNLVTGLATAFMDSTPVVAITGQVPTTLIGRDAFQEADVTGITLPVTKHNFLVRDVRELARVVREAFHLATTGRPGPVLIDVPKDVSNQRVPFQWPEAVDLPGYKPTLEGHPRQIAEAARAIAEAKRPLLYVGGGAIASGAHRELLELAERCGIPVVMTLMGLGAFPGRHPLSLGMLGMHGAAYANYAVNECDLLIAVGARFDDRVTGDVKSFAPGARKIHIDIDPAEIGKNVPVEVPIVGDVRRVLAGLLERVAPKLEQAWLDRIAQLREEFPLEYDDDPTQLMPQYVIEEVDRVTGGRAVVTTDVGQHQMWTAQYYRFAEPRLNITSGGLGTMGFGFPAAIGAAFARPEEPVVAVTGDGGFLMNLQELATAADYQVPVKVLVINNFYLGMVRQWQELQYDRRYAHSCLKGRTDFVKAAEAFGVPAIRVTGRAQVRPALEEAFALQGPVVVDFWVKEDENVWPMIPPGGSVANMLGVRRRSRGEAHPVGSRA